MEPPVLSRSPVASAGRRWPARQGRRASAMGPRPRCTDQRRRRVRTARCAAARGAAGRRAIREAAGRASRVARAGPGWESPPWPSPVRPRSLQPNARIEVGVEHVHHQVHEDEGRGEHEHRGLNDRVIAVVDGLHGQPADAGPGKDRLGDQGPPSSVPSSIPTMVTMGSPRSSARASTRPAGRRPLCAGRPDVVLAEDLEHPRAGQPDDPRRREKSRG